MKTIGIKLADGSFYPVLEEGAGSEKTLDLTTAHNNQTKVMVDLYRSANCTMEDAEYVDSLQIENLNEHPNGEPNITFQVSIDENNELSAKIVDPETGNQSNTTITLVSRTIEERLTPDEYGISDTIVEDSLDVQPESEPVKNSVAGVGLLAAAEAINAKNAPEDEFTLGDPDAEITSDDITDEALPESFDNSVTEVTEEAPFEETETSVTDEDLLFEESLDLNFDDPAFVEDTEPSEPEEPQDAAADFDTSFDMEEKSQEETSDIELPDFDDISIPDDNSTSDETIEDTFESSTTSDLDLPDFDSLEENSNLNFDAETESVSSSDETIEESALSDFDLDLPEDDFGENEISSEIDADSTFEPTIQENSLDDFSTDDLFTDVEDTDQTVEATSDDFGLPSFDDIPEPETSLDDDIFSTSTEESAPASSGISFTGLYDTETELGKSADYEEEDIKKKTKVPVIICIICAVICILATLLVLFIIPSKYNLISKKSPAVNTEVVETVEEPETIPEEESFEQDFEDADVFEEPELEPEIEEIPEAVEDEVIVIEKAEEVVPLPPPVVEEVKPKNITYKIKWGDTLWDIANTYYKNPWKYKYIARYNGIKDPDYIISGTYIIIPAE